MLMTVNTPRVLIAALRGGSGKTLLSVGLVAALRTRGMDVAVFKKGPDYIDAAWLGKAAEGYCYNLDTYLIPPDVVFHSFVTRSLHKDIAVIEGTRGLFDGVDAEGTFSTAGLAALLDTPLLLIVDVAGMDRTAAALVRGCRFLDQGLRIEGVVLNRVAHEHQERIVREAIEGETGIRVLGSLRKLSDAGIPQRHLGVLPLHEHPDAQAFITLAAQWVEECVDLDAIVNIARNAGEYCGVGRAREDGTGMLFGSAACKGSDISLADSSGMLRIGIVRDSAFQFYYPENIEALHSHGARIVEVSALHDPELPELDALYIGGGFPETHGEQLANNRSFRASVLRAIQAGLPVYAECGGLMYLSKSLHIDHQVFPMVGAFSVETILRKRPQGLGYIRVQVTAPNPFFPVGCILTGHEFHYSSVTPVIEKTQKTVFRVLRGHGVDGVYDGLCQYNTMATYVHLHALGERRWAEGILRSAFRYRMQTIVRNSWGLGDVSRSFTSGQHQPGISSNMRNNHALMSRKQGGLKDNGASQHRIRFVAEASKISWQIYPMD